MKIEQVICGIAAILTVSGCAKELVQEKSPEGCEYEFTAGLADNTKTAVQSDGSVWWSPKEEITIFYGDKTKGKFTSTNTSTSATTTFKGTFDSFDGTIEVGNTANEFWAVYPYDETATCDGNSVSVSVSSTQTAVAGSFNNNLFPSIAKSTNLSLSFWNLCGGIKFTVSQKGIKQVTFKGNNGETLAGTLQVKTDEDGRPYVYSTSSSQTEVIVTAPDGGEFKTGTDYYIITLPTVLNNGYSIKFTKSSLEGTFTSSNAQEIKRSIFGVLAEKDKETSFIPRDGYITFVDESAKYACLEAFDSNKDDKLSYAEAFAATTLSGVFSNYNGMTVFPELEYFVNVTDLSGAFNGCANLKEITVPDNITVIGTNAFTGCTKLREIAIPDSVTSISDGAFDSNLDVVCMVAATPPDIVSSSFADNTDIYVPEESLNAYKLRNGWKEHKDHIFSSNFTVSKSSICIDEESVSASFDINTPIYWTCTSLTEGFSVDNENGRGNATITVSFDGLVFPSGIEIGKIQVSTLLGIKTITIHSVEGYVQITDDLEDWSGNYLIVWGTEAHATISDKDLAKTVDVTISEKGAIPSSDEVKAANIVISKVDGGYTVLLPSGKYLSCKENANKCAESADPFTFDSITVADGISGKDTKDNVRYLYYNSNNNAYRFYVKKDDSAYIVPTLYKLLI